MVSHIGAWRATTWLPPPHAPALLADLSDNQRDFDSWIQFEAEAWQCQTRS